jgi:hypothetical protein
VSQQVTDYIAAETAKLVRLVPAPTGELGYGRDLSCLTDVTEALEEVDPASYAGIGQALFRRLITPRGALPDDPDYGFDVQGALNRGTTTAELRALEVQIRLETLKDDRVEDALVTVTIPALNELRILIMVTPADPSLTSFSLTFAVINGQLTLEQLG